MAFMEPKCCYAICLQEGFSVVCTHAVMSYLKFSVISPKTAHRFCYCFALYCQLNAHPSTGCFEENLRTINFLAQARQHQLFLSSLPQASHPLMEFLGFEQSDIMILDWVRRRACLPLSLSLQPFSTPIPRHEWCIAARELPDLGGG